MGWGIGKGISKEPWRFNSGSDSSAEEIAVSV